MSSNNKISSNDIYKSVGNAWMLCRSKTHQGHVYYFNTLTGETAWNLSDEEIQKARRRTGNFSNILDSNNFNYPEPTEPPDQNIHRMAINTTNLVSSSNVYNKQIINNRFTKNHVALSPFGTPQCNTCSPMTQLMQQSPTLNPNVWAITHNPQILLTPNQALIYPQSTFTLPSTVENNVQIPGPSYTIHNKNHNRKTNDPSKSYKYFKKNSNKSYYNRSFQQRKSNSWNSEKRDLRQVLAEKRKRCNSTTQSEVTDTENANTVKQNSTQTEDCVSSSQDIIIKDELYPSDIDEEWLEENTHYQGVKPLINVAPLIDLTKENARTDCWYIVVDTSVLLNNLDFLNVLVNSDDNCLLMTPQCTMDELKAKNETGSPREKKRSRRAMYFLSQQISSGCAFLGEDVYENEELGNHAALICCSSLVEQNNHAIMLSNDPDVLQYRNNIPFPMFAISSLKEFLITTESEKQCDNSCGTKEKSVDYVHNSPIIVTITNDFKEDSVNEVDNPCGKLESINKVSTAVQTDDNDIVMAPESEFYTEEEDAAVSEAVRVTPLNKSPVKMHSCDINVHNLISESLNTNISKSSHEQKSVTENHTALTRRKREIRLKRNLFHEGKGNQNNQPKERKQFKWHRRRTKSVTETVSETDFSKDNLNKQNERYIETEKHNNLENSCAFDHSSNKSVVSESPIKQNGNVLYSDIVANTDSFTYIPRSNFDENVVIEETSTSGVLSNSASIAESESVDNPFHELFLPNNLDNKTNNIFAITDPVMEDNLRRKSDEWVSRFTQIMEDVLTEVLQQDPPFVDSKMCPPWTMYEAVECTKRKYCKFTNVINACSKLSFMLFKMSDSKGVITHNISPKKFMEMYSFGVNLIDSLLSINGCEDLKIAKESLSNLLIDINDPMINDTMDTTKDDSFTENMNEMCLSSVEGVSTTSPIQTPVRITDETTLNSPKNIIDRVSNNKPSPSTSSNKNYNLRSKREETPKKANNSPKKVTFIRRLDIDVKSTFFSSLSLQKRTTDTNEEQNDNPDTCAEKNKDIRIDSNPGENESDPKNKVKEQDEQSTQGPKIIRNFTQCLEFEEKLKKKESENLDLDHLDYEGDDDNGYDNPDEDIENNDVHDDNGEALNHSESLENCDSYRYGSGQIYAFKAFIAQLWYKIKFMFTAMCEFCVEKTMQLTPPCELSSSEIMAIKYQAQEAQLLIRNLCVGLESIKEEINCEEFNVQDILKRAGIEIEMSCNLVMNEEQFQKYEKFVAKSIVQAEILLESIDDILNAEEK